jgi:hypothetical protein
MTQDRPVEAIKVSREDKCQNQTDRKTMKNIIAIVSNSLVLSTAIFMATTASMLAKPSLPIKSEDSPPSKVAIVQKIPRVCFDLAVNQLGFQYIGPQKVGLKKVRVTGVIRNVGTTNFRPRPFADAKLYMTGGFGTLPHSVVSTLALPSLAPGQEVKVIHDTTWDSSSTSEGEFPPNYILRLQYPVVQDSGMTTPKGKDGGLITPPKMTDSDCNTSNDRVEKNIRDVDKSPRPPFEVDNPPTKIQ